MPFLGSLDIVGSALTAENFRANIALQNMANAKTTVTESGEPYRRQQVVFEERALSFQSLLTDEQRRARLERGTVRSGVKSGGVRVAQVVESDRDFLSVYDPTHPQADENGYVQYPNVDTTEEMIDLMAASNAYDVNLTALNVVKAMIRKALEMNNS